MQNTDGRDEGHSGFHKGSRRLADRASSRPQHRRLGASSVPRSTTPATTSTATSPSRCNTPATTTTIIDSPAISLLIPARRLASPASLSAVTTASPIEPNAAATVTTPRPLPADASRIVDASRVPQPLPDGARRAPGSGIASRDAQLLPNVASRDMGLGNASRDAQHDAQPSCASRAPGLCAFPNECDKLTGASRAQCSHPLLSSLLSIHGAGGIVPAKPTCVDYTANSTVDKAVQRVADYWSDNPRRDRSRVSPFLTAVSSHRILHLGVKAVSDLTPVLLVPLRKPFAVVPSLSPSSLLRRCTKQVELLGYVPVVVLSSVTAWVVGIRQDFHGALEWSPPPDGSLDSLLMSLARWRRADVLTDLLRAWHYADSAPLTSHSRLLVRTASDFAAVATGGPHDDHLTLLYDTARINTQLFLRGCNEGDPFCRLAHHAVPDLAFRFISTSSELRDYARLDRLLAMANPSVRCHTGVTSTGYKRGRNLPTVGLVPHLVARDFLKDFAVGHKIPLLWDDVRAEFKARGALITGMGAVPKACPHKDLWPHCPCAQLPDGVRMRKIANASNDGGLNQAYDAAGINFRRDWELHLSNPTELCYRITDMKHFNRRRGICDPILLGLFDVAAA